jgi:hypothetical protein
VRNINSIRGSDWYITINVWKMCNGKIDFVSFVIKSGRRYAVGVKFNVNVKKWEREMFLLFLGYINGI